MLKGKKGYLSGMYTEKHPTGTGDASFFLMLKGTAFVSIMFILCFLSARGLAASWWTSTEYVELSSQTQDVSTDTLSVEINGTVRSVSNIYNAQKKKNDSGYSSSATYACAAYPHKFYSDVYGITIYNLLGTNYVPKVSSGGGSFTEVSTPKIGDIIRVNTSTHWGIVKSVANDGTVTVIQQNAGYFDANGVYKAMINTKVSKPYSSISFFRWSGAVDLVSTTEPSFPLADVPPGVYVIHSAWDDNICLDITSDSMENNANIQLYHRVYNNVQKFEVIKADDTYYFVKSVYNGRWLDAKTPLGDNSNVKLYDTNTGTENYWYFEDAGNGYVYIRNKSEYYLDVQGDQAVDHANVQLYHYVGNNSQKWRLESVSSTDDLSTGVKNIVNRAYQQVNMEWTPLKTVRGWNNYEFTAGTTYKGVPYGQPYDSGTYLKYPISFDTFLAAVKDGNSVFYTKQSAGKQPSVYYCNDCSAFVSYCYGLSSRQTTSTLGTLSTMTQISSLGAAEVGDCMNKAGSHVVLITNIYSSSGTTYYEICEQTPPKAKMTTYTATEVQSKYLNNGYVILRYSNRDSVGEPDHISEGSTEITDNTNPVMTSTSFEGNGNIGYNVTCSASDDNELAEIYIGSWNDTDGIDNAVWQSVAVTGKSKTVNFSVTVQNGHKEVFYHTNVYARDASGNISEAVRCADYFIGDGGVLRIREVLPVGISDFVRLMYPGENWGAYMDISANDYDMFLFDHWESESGIILDANSKNTTYIIPAGGGTIDAVYIENPDYIPIEPGEEWTEMEYIPYYIDTAKCDIEYKYQYSQTSVNSPGDGWVKGAEVNSHYEDAGPLQEFNTEQTESDTFVYVGYYYYHYCGPNAATNYCNYEQTEKYTTYHNIGTSDDYIIEKTFYDNGGDCYSYQLKWRNDQSQYVYCADHRSPIYYRKYQYQPRILVKEYMWTKETDWTAEANPNPELNTSVSYRIRLKQFPVSFDANGGSYSTESQVKYYGVALILPAEIPVRNEYAFTGWNTKADGSGTSYEPGSEYQEDAAVTLYAQWRASGTIYLPADLKTIEEEAFSGLPVGIVHVPSGCVEIQSRAFADCEQLKSVYIPASVKTVALDAFENCPNLTIHAPSGSIAIKVAKYNDVPYVEE